MGYKNTALKQIIINKAADLPTPVDLSDWLWTCYHLENAKYRIGKIISIDYPIVAGDNYTYIHWAGAESITYTGTGGMFRGNSTTPIWWLDIRDCKMIASNASGTIFDITEWNEVIVRLSTLSCADTGWLGSILWVPNVFLTDMIFSNYTSALSITNATILYARWIAFAPWANIGDAQLKIYWTFLSNVFTDMQFIPVSWDSWLYIDSAINGRVEMGIANIVTAYGWIPFKSGSLDQTDPRIRALACPNIPDSNVIGSMYMERNTNDTTITETWETWDITSIADAWGWQVTVTSTSHWLSNGETVWIIDDEYTWKFTISNVATDTFEITHAFEWTTTWIWETNWVKVEWTTIPSENERCSMTDNNELTFTNLEEQSIIITVATNPMNDWIAATKEWEFAVMKNWARIKGSLKYRQMTDKAWEWMIIATASAIAWDVFEVYVRNIQDTTDMIMVNMNITIR